MRSIMRLCAAALPALWLVGSQPVRAGTLSSIGVTNNSTDGYQESGAPSCAQTRTSASVLSQSASTFTTRFQQSIVADSRLTTAISISQSANYTINFTATCPPGPYNVHVDSSLNGAFTIVDDSSGCGVGGSASADLSAVSGSYTGGMLAGTLGLIDPGDEINKGARDVAFNRTASATISNMSGGAPIAHSLTFGWTGSCASNASAFTCGLECAVRLGMSETFSPCQGLSSTTDVTADDYPGVNGRVAANDGHFVTVTLECLCGNGMIDGSEECDEGAANGGSGSCCSSTCTILPPSTVCRAAAGACDVAEVCTGIGADCPADNFQTASTPCTSDGNECTEDICNGAGGCTHPSKPEGTSCNGGAGSCSAGGVCGPVLTPTPTHSPSPTPTAPILCGATPQPSCRMAGSKGSGLQVKYVAGKDSLKWKWKRGPATLKSEFGSPASSTNYTLCVYEYVAGTPSLAVALRAPAARVSLGKPSWRETPKGFKYTDKALLPDGLASLVLKSGAAGKASITLKARDPNLDLPVPLGGTVLKQSPRVVVQLVNDMPDPMCWGAQFSAPAKVNNFTKFNDSSD